MLLAVISNKAFLLCAGVLMVSLVPLSPSWFAVADPSIAQSFVKNIRVGHSPDYVRVVFDLERPPIYAHQQFTELNRATILMKNIFLGQKAQQAIINVGIPHPMKVYSWQGDQIRIDFDLNLMGTFRFFDLKNPYRFVIDLYDVKKVSGIKKSNPDATTGSINSVAGSALAPVRLLTEAERHADRAIQTIVIDPGHGGKDSGASFHKTNMYEKDLVLDISLRLKNILEDRHDVSVYMTRETDVFIELEERAKFANAKDADLFVSIHVNAHPTPAIQGLEVYMFGAAEDQRALEVAARENGTSLEEAGEVDVVSLLIAEKLLEKKINQSRDFAWVTKTAMSEHLGKRYSLEDLGVKTAPFYVLRHTAMPGILAEVAYLTNPGDRKHLASSVFRQQAAESIFSGIVNYISSLAVPSGS